MEKEVLTVNVNINGFEEVKGKNGEACMILFDGTAEGSGFKGFIGPSAADTQKQEYGKERFLSARYILTGKDADGKDCRIFIENNGAFEANGEITTHPVIYTNSENLSWMETSDIFGKIEGKEGGVLIHLFKK